MWDAFFLFKDLPVRRLAEGELIFRRDFAVTHMFWMHRGTANLVRYLTTGAPSLLHQAKSGAILAEASAYSDVYHCDCLALTDTKVAALPKSAFLAAMRNDADLAEKWAAHLAHSVQSARARAELRSLKTVKDRLEAWISLHGDLPDKGHWHSLANDLSVSPEALYRELAKRR